MAPEINLFAILLSSVFAVIFHFSYFQIIYRPFGEKFKISKKFYPKHFLASLIKAYILAHILKFTFSDTFNEAMEVSFWVWLGFIATTLLSQTFLKKTKLKSSFFVSAYYLIELLGIGIILSFWN